MKRKVLATIITITAALFLFSSCNKNCTCHRTMYKVTDDQLLFQTSSTYEQTISHNESCGSMNETTYYDDYADGYTRKAVVNCQ